MGVSGARRITLLVVLWLVLAAIGVRSWRGVERRLAVERLCEAYRAGDYAAVIDAGPELVGSDAPGRQAAECRALALVASDRLDDATALLEDVLATSQDWLPEPPLVLAVAAKRREQGRIAAAAELVRRATKAHPDDIDLLCLELDLRAGIEAEPSVLADLERRLGAAGDAAPLLRIRLAQRWSQRGELQRAEALFGDAPPAPDQEIVDEWYRARAALYGQASDPQRVAAVSREWLADGGRPADVLAWHALTLSIYQLSDPEYPVVPMLRQAVARRAELSDQRVASNLYRRLIGTLIVAGHHQEALALLDQAQGLDLSLTREDILRSAEQARRRKLRTGRPRGRLRFRVDPRELPATLLVSAAGAPVDRDYTSHDFPSAGVLEVEGTAGTAPQRWVFRGRGGRTASGTAWLPAAASNPVVEVRIEPRPGRADRRSLASPRAPGPSAADGRRRVFTVILDCADWRLVQYLRTRGDLPVLDALLGRGYRAVLASRPPFTAAALESLVRPSHRRSLSPVSLLYQLGTELEANTILGENPASALAWLVPESTSLFETVGAGDHVVLNLLAFESGLRGPRQGETVGPWGAVGRFAKWKTQRALEADEKRFFHSRHGKLHDLWVEEVAASFDSALAAVETDEVDLLVSRIASLDLATHGLFAAVSETGQDDGDRALYDLYRYIDHRIGELYRRLDGDDVLIVMSDHGIRTSMEHDWRAFFVAVGATVPHGRMPGTPGLPGVSRLLAELLEVDTDWEWHGVVPWEEPG